MEMAQLVAERATCPRASVGAIATKDKRVVGTGYNGAPAGMPHCLDVGCEIINETQRPDEMNISLVPHCIRASHAEANLIAWCAREGISLKDATLYTTHALCLNCAKLVINAGFRAVHYTIAYAPEGIDLVQDARILTFKHE